MFTLTKKHGKIKAKHRDINKTQPQRHRQNTEIKTTVLYELLR